MQFFKNGYKEAVTIQHGKEIRKIIAIFVSSKGSGHRLKREPV